MKRRGSQEQITHSLKKHNLNFTSSATIMSLKSFEHGNNGGMTQLMFVKDHWATVWITDWRKQCNKEIMGEDK